MRMLLISGQIIIVNKIYYIILLYYIIIYYIILFIILYYFIFMWNLVLFARKFSKFTDQWSSLVWYIAKQVLRSINWVCEVVKTRFWIEIGHLKPTLTFKYITSGLLAKMNVAQLRKDYWWCWCIAKGWKWNQLLSEHQNSSFFGMVR